MELLLQREKGLSGFQEIAENVGEVQNRVARALRFARNNAIEGVQRIEQKMRMNLRLQSAQLRLRNQAPHFGFAKLLNLLYGQGCRATEGDKIFVQIPPPTGPTAE